MVYNCELSSFHNMSLKPPVVPRETEILRQCDKILWHVENYLCTDPILEILFINFSSIKSRKFYLLRYLLVPLILLYVNIEIDRNFFFFHNDLNHRSYICPNIILKIIISMSKFIDTGILLNSKYQVIIIFRY